MQSPFSTPAELRQRRRQLRQQRRRRTLKACWQVSVIGSIVGGIVWMIGRPDWIIHKPQQIQVSGNRFLASNTVKGMLGLQYPVSMLHVEPQVLNSRLVSQGIITAVTIQRELSPPRITVQVQDRPPVALAEKSVGAKSPQMGLVNEQGHWLPLASYQIKPERLPKLKLLAANDLCPEWPELYPAIQQSPVQVSEINCRNQLNLMLKTEIGNLRLGSFDRARIYKQLQAAHKLRHWQEQYRQKYSSTANVAYIDLENPQIPKLQLINKNNTKIPTSSP